MKSDLIENQEFPEVVKKLLETAPWELLIPAIFPALAVDDFKDQFRQIKSVEEFQEKIIYAVIRNILKISKSSFTYSGLDELDKHQSYMFISNHRDIVLDPALLNYALFENKMETAEVAIGDNLLSETWIRDLVKMNKSFIVKRNLAKRELILASRLLSEYIFETVHVKGHSAWIAQREGRAKDGNDRTQQAW